MGGQNWQLCLIHRSTCESEADWLTLAKRFHELCRPIAGGTVTLNNEESDSDCTITSDLDADPKECPKPSGALRVDDGEIDFSSSDEGEAARAEPDEPSQMNVQGLTRVLCKSAAHHTPLPQALGQRAADLPHKTSCA